AYRRRLNLGPGKSPPVHFKAATPAHLAPQIVLELQIAAQDVIDHKIGHLHKSLEQGLLGDFFITQALQFTHPLNETLMVGPMMLDPGVTQTLKNLLFPAEVRNGRFLEAVKKRNTQLVGGLIDLGTDTVDRADKHSMVIIDSRQAYQEFLYRVDCHVGLPLS